MNKEHSEKAAGSSPAQRRGLPLPLKILFWPFVFAWKVLYKNWLSYLFGRVLRDENRIYSIKFIWYGDSVYLHPMIWGSIVLFFVQKSGIVSAGWPLLIWFILLGLCFLTVMYNFDIFKTSVLGICLIAVFGLAYVTNSEWEWNPLDGVKDYVTHLNVTVSDGFYIASAWIFAFLISAEVIWAWLFNRVELDESYVYEHRFLQGTTREPIFARGLKRSHEHSDHVCGLDVFLRRHRAAPVWTTRGTWSRIDVHSNGGGELSSGTTIRFGSLNVTPVATSHDAAEPLAYVFDDGDHSAAVCTDTGIVTPLLEQRLQGCELLLLETNHDKDMLRHGPYPWSLKQRIDSRTGHLSNHQSCEAIDRVGSKVLKAVVGMHLSAENNCPNLVCENLGETVANGTEVCAVTRSEMLAVTLDGSGVRFNRRSLPG